MANMSELLTAYPSHGEDRITQLPGELLAAILSYLSTCDLAHCLQVCKSWSFKALACESLWRQMSITDVPEYRILPLVARFVRHLSVTAKTRHALCRVTRILSSPETIPLVGLSHVVLFIHESMNPTSVHELAQALAIVGIRLEAVELGYSDSASSATLEDLVLVPCPHVRQVTYSIHGDEPFTATRQWYHLLVTTRMLTDLRIQTDAQMTADQIRMVLLAAPCLSRLSLSICEYDAIAVIADHPSLVYLDFNYYDHSIKPESSWKQQVAAHLPPMTTATNSSRHGLRVVHLGWVATSNIDLIASLLIRHRTTLEDLAIKERLGSRSHRRLSTWQQQLIPSAITGQQSTPAPFFPRLTIATLNVTWDTPILTTMLSRFPVLASLSMAHMHSIQGPPVFEALAAMPHLEHLAIDTCTSIASGLDGYLRSQPRLREMALYGEIPALTDDALDALGSLTSLRCLDLGQMDNTVRLDAWASSVGTLDALRLSNMTSVDDAILLKLGDHVRKLHLDMLWSVTDHGLASFVEQACTTQELHVSLCPAISKKAVWMTTSNMHVFVKE